MLSETTLICVHHSVWGVCQSQAGGDLWYWRWSIDGLGSCLLGLSRSSEGGGNVVYSRAWDVWFPPSDFPLLPLWSDVNKTWCQVSQQPHLLHHSSSQQSSRSLLPRSRLSPHTGYWQHSVRKSNLVHNKSYFIRDLMFCLLRSCFSFITRLEFLRLRMRLFQITSQNENVFPIN